MEIEEKAKKILLQALSFRASDIHFVPMEDKGVIRIRMDGQLFDMEETTVEMLLKLIAHLKFISGMDVGEKRRPQNSSIVLPLSNENYAMRLSTFPSSYHETLVIRLFPQQNYLPLHELALFPNQGKEILNLMKYPNGLIIVCGPTGSGKTTTIYSLLQSSLNEFKRNIITLEDPVEQKNDHFLQMEINERAGITYSVGLRSLLRHDPDLIMIGEIRDSDTAKMAVRAAMTGHLVLSTLHSSNTVSAIKRLHELGIPYSNLRETIKGVISQRLVNLICPYCGYHCHPYCRKTRKRRRGAIYEILAGGELREAIHSQLDHVIKKEYSLSYFMCKAIALGFVDEKEYDYFG